MVIYYDLETKEIERITQNDMEPNMPFNMTVEERIQHYLDKGIGCIAINDSEAPTDILDSKVVLDSDGSLLNIVPIEFNEDEYYNPEDDIDNEPNELTKKITELETIIDVMLGI